jgi:membrane fusion protein (multidrug efflux system)
MKKRLWLTLLVLFLVFGSIFGFKIFMYFMIRRYMAHFEMPPAVVSAVKVQTQDWQPVLTSSGQITPVHGVNLTARDSGMIEKYVAQSGDWVKKGDVILVLNHDALDAQLTQAKVSVQLAMRDLERQKSLYLHAATSRQVLEDAEATLTRDDAQVETVQAGIEDHIVRAPFDGQVGIMPTNLGQYVNPGDNLGMIVDARSFWVEFPVTQQELSQIKLGSPLSFTVDAYPDVIFSNNIKYIDNYFSSQTYSLMVRGLIQNTDLKHPLYSGMMININMLLPALKDVVVVDQDDIVSTLYGDSVFLVEGDKKKTVKQVPVKVGDSQGSKTVLLSGVKAGDEIVTSGQMKLQDGSPIALAE